MAQDDDGSRLQLRLAGFGALPGEDSLFDTGLTLAQVPQLISLLQQTVGAPERRLPTTSRGAWTQQEDDRLRDAVSKLGTKKWADIARFVPTRTSKQCRERWIDRLAPKLKKQPFEQWEDAIIIKRQREFGNRWVTIAAELPGRSPGSVKNRWYSGLRHQAGVANPNPFMSLDPDEAAVMALISVDHQAGDL